MPGVVLLVAAVVVNYARHCRGHRTICQVTRAHIPAPVFSALFAGGFIYLLTHVLRGYPKEIR